MPLYNTAPYLKEAIDSILNQTFADFEFLIIDDASTDGSVDIVKSYHDPRIKLIQKPKNTGLTNSINMGLDAARGEYIARMDSDDISLPDRFAKQVAFLDAHPQVGVCGTWVDFIGSQTGTERKETDAKAIKNNLFRTNQFCHPAVFIRAATLREHGIRFVPALEPAEDYAFWISVSRVAQLVNLPEVLLHYRIHPHQVSRVWSKEQSERFDHLRLEQVKELGIACSPEEGDLHLALLKGTLPATATNVFKAYQWINRLDQHNEKTRLFDPVLFRAALRQDWARLVGNLVSYNRSLAMIALNGRLPVLSLLTTKEKITFLPKCLLQWQTRI
jgi:glycosyltransferase involved in cell wall biosynthesis